MSRSEAFFIGLIGILFCWPYLAGGGIVGNAGDIYLYAAPFRYFSTRWLQAGEFPLWNPSIFAGAPFQASPQSALFYPLSQIFYALRLAPAFNLFCLFHFLMNSAGMFLFARALRISRSAALASSAIWAYSFYFLSKPAAGHAIHLSGYAWAPWVLLLALRLFSRRAGTGAGTLLAALILGSAMQFLSGHVQVWLYVSGLIGLFALRSTISDIREKEARRKKIVLSMSFVAGFAAISAAQLFPTLSALQRSSRSSSEQLMSEDNAYEFATSYSLRPRDFWTLIQPQKFGSPVRGDYQDPEHPSIYFETQALYMGWLPLVAAAGGILLLLFRRSFFIPSTAVIFSLLALGGSGPVYPLIWKALSFQRVPARFYLIVLLCLTLAAAYFWQERISRRRAWVQAALLGLILLDLFAAGRAFIRTEDPAPRLGKSPAIAWLQDRQSYFPARVHTTPDIGNPNKLMFFGISNVNGYEAMVSRSLLEYFLRTQPGAEITSTGIDVASDNAAFKLFGVRHIVSTGRDLTDWPVACKTGPVDIRESRSVLPPAMAVKENRAFSRRDELLAYLNSGSFHPSLQILSQGQAGLIDAPAAGAATGLPVEPAKLIKWSRLSGDRLDMAWKIQEPSFWIFLSESFDPGWKAWDGWGNRLDVFEANGYFLGARISGAELDNGKVRTEKVFWRYLPVEFLAGCWMSLLAAAILSFMGISAAARVHARHSAKLHSARTSG